MLPRVLVGCPTSDYHEYCVNEYIDRIKNLSYKNYDILLVDNSKTDDYYKKLLKLGVKVIKTKYFENAKDRIVDSRNILRRYAIENNYDYLLSLEQDVIPEKNVIDELIKHKEKIVSGVYFNNFPKDGKDRFLMCLWVNRGDDKETIYHIDEIELHKPKVIEITACGLGCILLHKDVLEKIEFRYEKDAIPFDDVYFCMDVKKKGFKIYANTGVVCKHLFLKRPWDWKELKL